MYNVTITNYENEHIKSFVKNNIAIFIAEQIFFFCLKRVDKHLFILYNYLIKNKGSWGGYIWKEKVE